MAEEEFTYRHLRHAHQLEKKFAPLADIEPSFYIKAMKFIELLEKKMNDVSPSESKILEREIKNAKQTLESIYELREKKIASAALAKVRGGNPDIKRFLPVEKELFDELVKILFAFRERVIPSEEKEVTYKKEEGKKNSRGILIVKEDIPTFIGTDMKRYNLRKNDIVSMKMEMLKTLEKRGVGERIYI